MRTAQQIAGEMERTRKALIALNLEWCAQARREGSADAFAYCSECGSRDVQVEGWKSVNSGEDEGDTGAEYAYCPHCAERCTGQDGHAGAVYVITDRREAAEARLSVRREMEAEARTA